MNKVANHIFRQATFQIIEASLIKFGLRKYSLNQLYYEKARNFHFF